MFFSKYYLKTFLLFLFAYFASFLWVDWQNSYIASDIAGDVLHANQLKEEGYLLLGHWSKFGFNHPGPFWFYFNAFIELILSPFDLHRLQMWQWGTTFLNSIFIVFSALSLSKYYFDKINFNYAILFIFIYCLFAQECSGIWIPYRLTAPYLAFVICLLHLFRGNFHYSIPAVFLNCILIHGYATMPFFTLPFLFLSIVFGFRQIKDLKPFYKDIVFSFLIALLFALPIIIDFYLNQPSNIDYLFAAAKNMQIEKQSSFSDVLLTLPSLILTDNKGTPYYLFYISFFVIVVFLLLCLPSGKIDIKDLFAGNMLSKIVFSISICLIIYACCIFYHWKYTSQFVFYVLFYLMALPPLFLTSLITPLFFAAENNLKNKSKNHLKIISLLACFFIIGTTTYKQYVMNTRLFDFFMSPYRFLSDSPSVTYYFEIIQKEYQRTGKPITIADPFEKMEDLFIFDSERSDAIGAISIGFASVFIESDKNHIPICFQFTEKTLKKHPSFRPFYTRKHLCPTNLPPTFVLHLAPPAACNTTDVACAAFKRVAP